jgi:hypothetical protein
MSDFIKFVLKRERREVLLRMSQQTIAFARAHCCIGIKHFHALADVAPMAKAELQSSPVARSTTVSRGRALDADGESTK